MRKIITLTVLVSMLFGAPSCQSDISDVQEYTNISFGQKEGFLLKLNVPENIDINTRTAVSMARGEDFVNEFRNDNNTPLDLTIPIHVPFLGFVCK